MKQFPILLLLAFGCGKSSSPSGTIQFTLSGETLAYSGYDFPTTADAFFVDGWQISFDELLVTVDKIKISENPDQNASLQQQTGPLVAELDGPWAVDLHQKGALAGAGGGGETAVPFASLANQNKNGGKAFDPTARYAFGFDTIAATATAKQVIAFTPAQQADYETMVTNGWVVYYSGTATWKGDDPGNAAGCISSIASYDESALPRVVKFKLGFASPTSYVNCQNGSDSSQAIGDEEHPRGVQIKSNAVTNVQVTIHTDHPFWESVLHDSPAHFDMLAAHAKPDGGGGFVVGLSDVKGVDYQQIKDGNGAPLPWRNCVGSHWANNSGSPQMKFDDQGIGESSDPSSGFRDLYDFMTFNQSTQGHLNSDGLCYVQHNYASPQAH